MAIFKTLIVLITIIFISRAILIKKENEVAVYLVGNLKCTPYGGDEVIITASEIKNLEKDRENKTNVPIIDTGSCGKEFNIYVNKTRSFPKGFTGNFSYFRDETLVKTIEQNTTSCIFVSGVLYDIYDCSFGTVDFTKTEGNVTL